MQLDVLLDQAKGTELTEPVAFRLPVKDKAIFFSICQEENLSAGKLLRSLVADFIREYEEHKNG